MFSFIDSTKVRYLISFAMFIKKFGTSIVDQEPQVTVKIFYNEHQ